MKTFSIKSLSRYERSNRFLWSRLGKVSEPRPQGAVLRDTAPKSWAIFLGIACAAARAQQPPVFSSESKVVLVDAVVTGKKGEYVRGLTAKDFRIWEDGKEQTIRSFSLAPDSSAAGPSSDIPRRLVLFFDDTGMTVADQASARQAAARFIDTYAGPNRLMAVVNLDDGLRVVQSFTENAARLKEAVSGVRAGASSSGLAPRETALGTAEANARNLIQSLGSLARNLNAVPGRKIIVLFAGGASFSGRATGRRDESGSDRQSIERRAVSGCARSSRAKPIGSGIRCGAAAAAGDFSLAQPH